MACDMSEFIEHFTKLSTPNIVGSYESFEVTEIIGFCPQGTPTNFMTLLVAEPGLPGEVPRNTFINPRPLSLPSTKWNFGISRFRLGVNDVKEAINHLQGTGEWQLASKPLKVGRLVPVPPQFVPADTHVAHPWNGVLKNNFFGGSHLLELFDGTKADHRFLFENPSLLSNLAERLRQYVPIGIDGLSDRIGNVLIQFPVTVAVTSFGKHEDGNFAFEPIWHPNTTPRPLRISWEIFEDATIEDFASTDADTGAAYLPVHSKRTGARYIVWDDANAVIVGASAQSAFFGSAFSVTGHVIRPKTREFLKPAEKGGAVEPFALVLRDEPPQRPNGPHINPREPWRSERIFRDSLHALRSRKEFVQYRGPNGASRSEALADIQWLMSKHGRNGVWLWDPYLAATDMLNTLFFCPWPDADLRGLSDGKVPKSAKYRSCGSEQSVMKSHELSSVNENSEQMTWRLEQKSVLEASKGNCAGLKLEFRVRHGNAGWPFHDRFLIFPRSEGGAAAWSLGTSVNSLGKQHHILQKVPDGELIKEAFLDLWNSLSALKYLVWKTP